MSLVDQSENKYEIDEVFDGEISMRHDLSVVHGLWSISSSYLLTVAFYVHMICSISRNGGFSERNKRTMPMPISRIFLGY